MGEENGRRFLFSDKNICSVATFLLIPCTSKIPAFYCSEMEISVAEEKHNSRDGAWGGEQEMANRGKRAYWGKGTYP